MTARHPHPVVILGAGGYVGGEMLRLVAGHPRLTLHAAVSDAGAGRPIAALFPHLLPLVGDATFAAAGDPATIMGGHSALALLSAAPHGASAGLLDAWMTVAERLGCALTIIDTSADFRHADPDLWARIYGVPHGAPERLSRFTSALPDLERVTPNGHLAHPGCFTTAVTLAAAPLHAAGHTDGRYVASAVTGSTGSGKSPVAATHHPERHGNLKAYQPLVHRHRHEMEDLVSRCGSRPAEIAFVPHSGPFARGIHATVSARLVTDVSPEALSADMRAFYAASPFVVVSDEPPNLKDVVGSNLARLSVHVEGRTVVVCSVIDNLVKGAAGGAVQWLNRRLGLDESEGLKSPATAWT